MTTPNKSEKLVTKSVADFINASFKYDDYYFGFGVSDVGYSKYSNRLSKIATNGSFFGVRISPNDMSAVYPRKDWSAGSVYYPYNSNIDPSRSICYNPNNYGIYLCTQSPSLNRQSNFEFGGVSRYIPDGIDGQFKSFDDGYKWVKIGEDRNPLTDWIHIRGIEALVEFKGSTIDATGPTGGNATGASIGTCCYYTKENREVNGICLNAGVLVQAHTVPNEWTCRLMGNLTDLHTQYKPGLLGICGGFFNYSGTAGCTPCDSSVAVYTNYDIFDSIYTQYSSTNTFRRNFEIQKYFQSGQIVNAVWFNVPSESYYVSSERPRVYVETDGTLDKFELYLKTEYIGSNLGWKVIGVEVVGEDSPFNCSYAEAVSLYDSSIIGSSPNGDFSKCLASIEFGLLPTDQEDDYLDIYALLRPDTVAVEVTVSKSEIYSITGKSTASFDLKSAAIYQGMKYFDGRKISPVLNRSYSAPIKKTSASVTISKSGGPLSQDSLVFDSGQTETNFLTNKLSREITLNNVDNSTLPEYPLSAYTIAFIEGSNAEISTYDFTSVTTSATFAYQNSDKTTGIATINSVINPTFKFDGCPVIFASNVTASSSRDTYNIVATFKI